MKILKLFLSNLIFSLIFLFFSCQNTEPQLEKTTILSYLGNGEITVETIIKTAPNLPTRIMTDGITTPNYLYVIEISVNGSHIDTSQFEFKYQKTEKGNFKYITLRNAVFNEYSDSIYIKYQTNILSDYQQSLEEGKYIFPVKMTEIIPKSYPPMRVNSVLITKSKTELYIPMISRRDDYDVKGINESSDLKYSRSYLGTGFDLTLFLPYPDLWFELNNLHIVGEYDRWISLKDLYLVEEGYQLKFRQIDSSKGIIFSLPFRKGIPHPDININIGGNNIPPFPIDSVSFFSTIEKKKLKPNEVYYYIGPIQTRSISENNYYFNMIFSMMQNDLASLDFQYSYNSKFILEQLDYFNYQIKYKLLYLPSLKTLNKLKIYIPEDYSFIENKSELRTKYELGKNRVEFSDINRPEFTYYPLVLVFSKDGASFYKCIRIINIVVFIISLTLYILFYFFNINTKYFYTGIFYLILIITNLFLIGFSNPDDLLELICYVWGFLLLIPFLVSVYYHYKAR